MLAIASAKDESVQADNRSILVTAALEPISPELVLVCPEFREQALAALPEVEWQSFVSQVRVRTPTPEPEEPGALSAVRETAIDLVHLLGFSAAAMLSCVVLTLALTLVANAIR